MTNGSHDVINPGHHSFLGEAWVRDYRHGFNHSSRNLAEDRTFIPLNILKTLYSVNPVFLHLALNGMYSEINLAIPWTAATTKYLNHLK